MKKVETFAQEFEGLDKYKKCPGLYGIELETETSDGSAYPKGFLEVYETNQGVRYKTPLKNWVGHPDGSLRNFGMEFVLDKPLNFEDCLEELDRFKEATKDVEFIKNAPATSTHVHVNVLNDTLLTFANFLTIYTLFESVLVDYSGESRRSNLFALPIRASTKTLDNMIAMLSGIAQSIPNAISFQKAHVKYACLNLNPLTTFGSLEIRSFRGETDIEEVKDWIRIINKMVEFARTDGLTPRDFLKAYQTRGSSEILTDVFQEMASKIREKVQDVDFLIDRNLYFMARVATCVPDWSKFNGSIAKIRPAKKESPKTDVVNVVPDGIVVALGAATTGMLGNSVSTPWIDESISSVEDDEILEIETDEDDGDF